MDIQSTEQESEPQYVSPEAQSSGLDECRELGNEVDSGDTPDDVSDEGGNPQDQELVDIPQSLDTFLQSIERRAFVMARYALKNEDDALDTVQDAMLKLCENYSDRPCVEGGPLFYRILNNVIIDRHRPRGMNRLKRWMGRPGLHFEEGDPLESMLDTMDTLPSEQPGPQEELVTNQRSTRINDALSLLSSQQREVFLLHDLNAEAASLTPEVVDRLATARHRAIMAVQDHPVSTGARTRHFIPDNGATGVALKTIRATGRSLQQSFELFFHTRPMSASLATFYLAVLVATLVFNPSVPHNEQTEQMALASPESGLLTSNVPDNATDPASRAASYEVLPAEQLSVVASEENLDLVGSVDFLLWLESKQS